MNDLILKQETLDRFLAEHFNLEGQHGQELSDRNMPAYVHTLNNFQDFMVTLDRKDWEKSLQISGNKYFVDKNEDVVTGGKKAATVDSGLRPATFSDISHMHSFVQKTTTAFRNKNQERIGALKTRINNLISELYALVLASAYKHENHRVPFYGIPHPDFENPVNLFQRQLAIE